MSDEESQVQPDLSQWMTIQEVCARLAVSRSWFTQCLGDGSIQVEKRKRVVVGIAKSARRPKHENVYNPADIEALAAIRKRPSGHGQKTTLARSGQQVAVSLSFDELFAKIVQILEKRHVERGRWLTVSEASRETGLSINVIKNVANKLALTNSPDVIQDEELKIRKGALEELTAQDLTRNDVKPNGTGSAVISA